MKLPKFKFKRKFKWSKVTEVIKSNGLDTLLIALHAASNAADMAALPPLKLACESAIQIIEIVQVRRVQRLSYFPRRLPEYLRRQ